MCIKQVDSKRENMGKIPSCSRRNVSSLRVVGIVNGLVGNPESSTVHRSQKSINQFPNSKFLGLSVLDTSLFVHLNLLKNTTVSCFCVGLRLKSSCYDPWTEDLYRDAD